MRLFHLLWLFILWLKMEKSLQSDVIKCRVPVIENGNVPGDTQEYNEHEVLHFKCNPNYIPTDQRPTTCTIQRGRAEWIPTPYCETTKCRLTLPPLEGTSYEPAYRNLFSPGDTVKVICGERHGISNLQNASATVTCKDDGKWTVRPLCIEVTCSNRRDPLVDNWRVQQLTLNGTARYTCRSGYRSKDGANMATCTRDGWRPNPLCQATHCPVIHVDDNVQVNGSLERAANGNVVRFSCKSNTDVLVGPTEIYCDESGLWSGDAPKCKGIKCEAPKIENGIVHGNIPEYDEHEVLHFSCNYKYKRTEDRPSTCTKIGLRAEWSPTPMCEPVKCRLTLPPLEGTSYEPAYRNVFTPDEQVTVTCGEKYWISSPRDISAVTTCTDTGEWTVRPICKEVACSNRRDRHVYTWDVYWGQKITLGDTARYRCRSNYKSPDGTYIAKCTGDGWRPNPLCQEIICEGQDIPHANIVNPKWRYKNNQRADYECEEGYRGTPTRTCRENGWTGDSQCTEITCEREDIPHANIVNRKWRYKYNELANYECEEGYRGSPTRTCGENGWTGDSHCTDIAYCHSPPRVENAFIVTTHKNKYLSDSEVTYQCHEDYTMIGENTLRCREGEWEKKIINCKTIASHCHHPPRIENAFVVTAFQEKYLFDSAVTYQCHDDYTMVGENTLRCKEGGWEKKNIICTHP